MINKINSASTNSPSFKAVSVMDIKEGVRYRLNEHFHDAALHGTERLYTSLESLADGLVKAHFRDVRSGKVGQDTFRPNGDTIYNFLDVIS